MLASEMVNPICIVCGRSLGKVTIDEFAALILREGNCGKCFDCERAMADDLPKIFHGDLSDSHFFIGDIWFHYDGKTLYPLTRAHERERAVLNTTSLSSVTYLHKNLKNRGVQWDGTEWADCGECEGEGKFFVAGHFEECGGCGGVGRMQTGITIPKWVIGGGCENV